MQRLVGMSLLMRPISVLGQKVRVVINGVLDGDRSCYVVTPEGRSVMGTYFITDEETWSDFRNCRRPVET